MVSFMLLFSISLVVMAGIIAIYGLVVSVIIGVGMDQSNYTPYKGWLPRRDTLVTL